MSYNKCFISKTIAVLLKNNDEVISVDLSNALNVSTARMAKLLTKMEKKNLIVKHKSLIDQRKTIVELTKHGKEQFLEYKNLIVEYLESIVNFIGVDKFEEYLLITLLTIIFQIDFPNLKNKKLRKRAN